MCVIKGEMKEERMHDRQAGAMELKGKGINKIKTRIQLQLNLLAI